ncbi:MAG TPA: XrtA/PEP-CTERM system histidine kinase PrsK [Casimicrobiaceae bacterium]|nr:XrtA/PEP-CTERM system histidine kinase PrsK [Casimicrobiaceae bacterium]
MTQDSLQVAALWSYGFAAAAFCVFALRMTFGWRGGVRAALLLSASLASALWAACVAVFAVWPEAAVGVLTSWLDTTRYALWFAFLSKLVGAGDVARTARKGIRSEWLIVAMGLTVAASLVFPDREPLAVALDQRAPMIAYALRIGLAVLGLMLVERLLRGAATHARWAVKPLCLGLAGVFGFDLFLYSEAMLFGRHDVDVWVARGVAHALVIPLIAVAAARNPTWTVEMHLSRGAVLRSTALLVSGLFLLAVAAAGYFVRFVGGEFGKVLQTEFLFAALLLFALAVFSGSFRSRLKVFVSKHFFSYRYDYREEWLRFTRTLASDSSPRGIQQRAINALADLVESPAGALWLKQDASFRPAARWNLPAVSAVEPVDGSLGRFLERTGWVVDVGEYASAPERYPELSMPEWLAALPGAWLVVPLPSASGLIGFVVLVTSRAAITVDWEVIDLLKTAGRQAASYLGQIQATEALLESRKFDAFNRMSAFVVHDLKNLIAQLSLMLRNAERHRDNPAFQRDMLMTVDNVVERMNNLMLQLRTGATPVEKPRPVNLEKVIRNVCRAKAEQRPSIAMELDPGISAVGHPDQLEHVIGHLVQNAIDATAGAGEIAVLLRRDNENAVIEVTDNGVGMTPEFIRDRLFRPFQTTKTSGMGVGVYESSQYVTELGGRILVESIPDSGTRVRVVLPTADEAAAARVGPREPA